MHKYPTRDEKPYQFQPYFEDSAVDTHEVLDEGSQVDAEMDDW